MAKEIKCIHANVKKKSNGKSVYIYEIREQTIYLCPQCNMLLAEKILGQLAIETFTH